MKRQKMWRRIVVGALTALLVLVAGAGMAVAFELRDYRQEWAQRILPGAVVNGVDLTGMTADEATAAIEGALAGDLDRVVTLRFGERTWTTTPRELGAKSNARQIAAAAVATSQGLPWIDLARIRWRGGMVEFEDTARVAYPAKQARALLRDVAADLRIDPVDARLSYTRTRPVVIPGEAGRAVEIEDTLSALMPAVRGETAASVDVVTRPVKPETTADHFRRVLFLRQKEHRLDLFVDGEIARTYTVATGTGDYPTPTGQYHVTQKRPRPVWINPDPNGWGKTMPARIEPGPNNPLGLRALNWSAPGAIRFHGTANVSSLGRDASHGCVRLSNSDILDLFDRVEEGDHIISLR